MTPTEALIDYLEQRGLTLDTQFLREALHTMAQAMMESEVRRILAAAPYERSDSRRAYRNGYRESIWRTVVGDLLLNIPKLRKGTYYPDFLILSAEPLLRLAQEAYVTGVTLDEIQSALAALSIVSLQPYDLADIAERLADVVYNAREASLNADYPALFLDVLDVEQGGLWRQVAIVLGVRVSGEIELLAHDLVSLADDRTWMRLLRQLRQRGLKDVDVVISSDYPGVRVAVEHDLVSAVWEHHRNFLLRGSAEDALVNAVSTLAVNAESDQRNLPRMVLDTGPAEFDPVPIGQLFFVVA